MKRLVYYISGHGLGHAVRSAEIIKALQALTPDLDILIRTTAPPAIFQANLDPCPVINSLMPDEALDIGILQIDSLRPELDATLARVQDLLVQAPAVISREKRFLLEYEAQAVVADVPFLAPAAARAAGLPSVLVSNFTWDSIYRPYAFENPGWRGPAEAIRDYYLKADLVIRLPMAMDMPHHQGRVRPVGLTGRRPPRTRDDIRRDLGVPASARLVLLTFNSLELNEKACARMAAENPGTVFLYSFPLTFSGPGFLAVDDRKIPYPELIKAADVVLTKPGYGITADCLANNAAMVYADRGDFPEYPVLVQAIETYLPHAHIPSGDLYAGRVAPYLDGLVRPKKTGPLPWSLNGAREAAGIILSLNEEDRVRGNTSPN